GRPRRGQPRGAGRPAPAARDSRVHRARAPPHRDVRPHRAGRSADRTAGRGRPARDGHPAAHRCRARRREGAARAARAVRALARSAARAGPRLAPHGDDRAGGRPLDHRRRARELRALQHRGGRRARAGGHRAGRSLHRRLDGGARGPGEVAGVDERARHPRRPPVLGGPVGPAPLRPARAGGARAARADDPSRGVQVTDARRLARALAALSLVLLAVGVTALFVGSAGLSPSAVARALAGLAEASSVEAVVTLSLRLPRVAAAVLAGGALAVAGVGFQALTRNPLAEPSVLGVSSGAAFGVVLAQILDLSSGIVAALGEGAWRRLGVNAERLKRRVFVAAALLTGTVVAFTGPIGFVGLIVPHVLRGLVGQDNRFLVPTAALAGGAFLLAADTLARNVVAPAELSVGGI